MKSRRTKLELYADTIRLRAAEKRVLRERLVSYMEFHPLLPAQSITSETVQIEAAQYFFAHPFIWAGRIGVLVFTLAVAIGIPAVAERTVPGDVLYPVKVRVNEEVKAYLTSTPIERVAWEVERVERRIAEARLLAKEGKLTPETEASIAATVREHADTASRELDTLRAEDADEAAVAEVALESALDIQSAVLAHESASTTPTDVFLDDIASAVKSAREGLKDRDHASLSYDRLFARIETETTRMRDLFSALEETVGEEEKGEIDRRIKDIEQSLSLARGAHAFGDDAAAIEILRSVLADIQKLIIFMTDIDVRANVTLETLVPKRLTAEERIALLDETLEAIDKRETLIRGALRAVVDEAVLEYAEEELSNLDAMIANIENARDEERLDDAEKALAEALETVSRVEKLVAEEGTLPLDDETGTTTATTTSPTTTPAAPTTTGATEEAE